MRIPDKFKLFSQQWQVVIGDEKSLPEELGMCYSDTHEILLRPTGGTESIIHVFLHEVIHAIELKLDLDMTERQVDLMALGLIDLFRNNPDLLELFGELE